MVNKCPAFNRLGSWLLTRFRRKRPGTENQVKGRAEPADTTRGSPATEENRTDRLGQAIHDGAAWLVAEKPF